MTRKIIKVKIDRPFNDLPLLPPNKESIETKNILRQFVKSSIALAELKGLVHILPNPDILLNAIILKKQKPVHRIKILESKQVWKETLYINTQLFELLKS